MLAQMAGTAIPDMPSPMQIFRLKAQGKSDIAYLTEIIEVAQKRGVRGWWLNALRAATIKNWILLTLWLSHDTGVRDLVYIVRTRVKRRLPPAIVLWIRKVGCPPD